MPLEREKHEEILNRLLDVELPVSDRTELLQQLRADYTQVIDEHTSHTKTIEKLKADNQDLVLSNSKLFHKIGVKEDDKLEKEHEKKTFSESVSLEQLEKE